MGFPHGSHNGVPPQGSDAGRQLSTLVPLPLAADAGEPDVAAFSQLQGGPPASTLAADRTCGQYVLFAFALARGCRIAAGCSLSFCRGPCLASPFVAALHFAVPGFHRYDAGGFGG